MVKVQDGQLILGGQALSGAAEDDEGKPIKFEAVEGAVIPAYQAKVDMKDGSGRAKFYSFSLADTNVRISVVTKTPEEMKAEEEGSKTSAAAAVAKTTTAEKKQEQQEPQPAPKTEKAFKTTPADNKTKSNKK